MDLTTEEHNSMDRGRSRRRMKHYDENADDSESDMIDNTSRQVLPPMNNPITVRYEVYWTEVADTRVVETHKVLLDVDSHFLVVDTLTMTLDQLSKTIGQVKSDRFCMKSGIDRWEMRFASSEGYPRYDYPCTIISYSS